MISGDLAVTRLLDEHPELLEVLASYHPHFRQLRNKLLCRVMAPRVTLQAARIAGVSVDDLVEALRRYGFLTTAMIFLPIAIAAGHGLWIWATAAVLSLGALAFAASLGRTLGHFSRGTARVTAARPAEAPAR